MFDISFLELIVIGIVALIVIGPERLPKVARTAGLLLARAQRYIHNIKRDISHELQLDELDKIRQEIKSSVQNLENNITTEVNEFENSLKEISNEANQEIEQLPHEIGALLDNKNEKEK